MKMKSLVCRGLSLFAFIHMLTSGALAQDATKVTVSVASTERATEYATSPNSVLKPEEGNEFAIVKLKIVAKHESDVCTEAKVFDSEGIKHSSVYSSLNFALGRQIFVFSVKKGMPLKAIKIGPETFDLSQSM